MAGACCLLGMTFDFFPPSPVFWSPCFLPREYTANFQLVLNVGVGFFQGRCQPMKQNSPRPANQVFVDALPMHPSSDTNIWGNKPAHLGVEEIHGTLRTPKAHLHSRYAWEWILCWRAYKRCSSQSHQQKKMSKLGNKLRFKHPLCLFNIPFVCS